ncbi:hypothetical protein EGW08_003990 [Elysia chlorotica]|uniref:PNT domain-containing protein n=1 Tax=Elysia chlorotica TaxID=188477 RepID=A0A433U321_ELYCH|nr:hypothetical protein EGW08_003990 [Elysia chlorotica]
MLVRPPPSLPSFHASAPAQFSPPLERSPRPAADVTGTMTISGSGASQHWPEFMGVRHVDRCGVGAASDSDGAATTARCSSGGGVGGGGGGGGSGNSTCVVGVGAEANGRTRHSSRSDSVAATTTPTNTPATTNTGGIGADGGCGDVTRLDVTGVGHSDIPCSSITIIINNNNNNNTRQINIYTLSILNNNNNNNITGISRCRPIATTRYLHRCFITTICYNRRINTTSFTTINIISLNNNSNNSSSSTTHHQRATEQCGHIYLVFAMPCQQEPPLRGALGGSPPPAGRSALTLVRTALPRMPRRAAIVTQAALKLPSSAGVPPLTPGTTQKMSHVIVEGFKTFEKEQRRFNIPRDPYQWSPCHVGQWLQWFTHEFSFEGLQLSNFQMDGRELATLGKKEFLERCPPYIGDIIWEHLDIMKKEMREERARLCNAPPNYSEAMCMHEFNDRIHRSKYLQCVRPEYDVSDEHLSALRRVG